MNELVFLRPEAAWALAAVAAVIAAWRLFRRPRFATLGIVPLLAAPLYRASRLRRAPAAAAIASLATIVAALMEPVRPHAEVRVQSHGLDIAIVLDLSSSMEESMGAEASGLGRATRLDVTKRAIVEFVARRPHDRIGLIVFSDNAYVVSPLTLDHDYLRRYVATLDERTLRGEGMTAIGEGLTAANALLARQAVAGSGRDRAIVLFTDGENNYGRDPFEALAEARNAGTRVHLIGVDLDADVKSKPQVRRLIRTVRRQGGRYFTADTRGQLDAASRAIDAMERGVLVSRRSVRNAPAFEPFAAAALMLVCAALLLRALPCCADLT